MDLYKTYEALGRDRCLEIFEGYAVGTRAHHALRHYWYRLTMVALTDRYYGVALRGFQGVTQGYPLSQTIFNVAVDSVICNWVSLVFGGAGGQEQWVREVL